MTASEIGLIWAQARGGVIGRDGGMPWHLPEDLARFRSVTGGHPVIMGRRTWESLPPRFRPLPGRRNIVLSRRPDWRAEGAEVADSIEAALATAGDSSGSVWGIGGSAVYSALMDRANRLEVTEIDEAIEGDTVAPEIGAWVVARADPESGWYTSSTGLRYRWTTYRRPPAAPASLFG